MPVPDFQSLMLPALKALAGGKEVSTSQMGESVAAAEGITIDDRKEMFSSGRQSVFVNRMSWAVIHMERAGLFERVRRGIYRITEEGEQLLAQPPSRLDMNYLKKYPDYVAWRTGKNGSPTGDDAEPSKPDTPVDTPEEALEKNCQAIVRCSGGGSIGSGS